MPAAVCRFLIPLLPLIFSQYRTLRRGLATLLTLLIFLPISSQSAATAQASNNSGNSTMHPNKQPAATLPAMFLQHFCFPCKVLSQDLSVTTAGENRNQQDAEVGTLAKARG